MNALPYELAAAHMAFDDGDDPPPRPTDPRLLPSRFLGPSWSAVRAAQRVVTRRRFLAGWAALNPAIAPALRRRR